MKLSNKVLWIVGIISSLLVVIVVTLLLVPAETNPAFDTAVTFVNAAGKGDDATALPLLDETLQAYVEANCPDSSVSACIMGYIPPEWGGLISAVYRRSAPDGDAWNVDMIATYENDRGVSGVCSHIRVEPTAAGEWQVAGWAGFIWCGDPVSRNMASNPDAPNRAP